MARRLSVPPTANQSPAGSLEADADETVCNRCNGDQVVTLNGQSVTCPLCLGSGTGENNADAVEGTLALAAFDMEMRAKYTDAEIEAMGRKGHAFKNPDGTYSYPIADEDDLTAAIKAVGRGNADHDAIRKYIIGRAKALGLSDLIPDDWNADGSLKESDAKPPAVAMRRDLRGNTETRVSPRSEFELREVPSGTGSTLLRFTGFASVTGDGAAYEMEDWMGVWVETVSVGAFDRTLADGADCAFLVNHGGISLARTRSGTLKLSAVKNGTTSPVPGVTGLYAQADLDPANPHVQAVRSAVERKDLSEMSFAFRVLRDDWNAEYTTRTINEVSLHQGDCSIVNFGANPFTADTVSIRQRRPFGLIDEGRARAHALDLASLLEESRRGTAKAHALLEELRHPPDHRTGRERLEAVREPPPRSIRVEEGQSPDRRPWRRVGARIVPARGRYGQR